MKWKKTLFLGLEANTAWARIAKILKLEYVKDNIAFMKECPRIQERYVSCKELALPGITEVNNDFENLNLFQRQIQSMILKFDAMFKDVEKRVDAVSLRTSACEENLLNRLSTRLANNVT